MPQAPEYFYDEEVERWLAVTEAGIFSRNAEEPTWTFAAHGSLRWDSLHQRIYLDGRWVEALGPLARLSLPALPQVTAPAVRSWADNFDADRRVAVATHPRLAALLHDEGERPIYVLLHEDRWESIHGDGHFNYLRAVYLDEAPAQTAQRELEGEYSRGHLRTMSVAREGEAIWVPRFAVETFDHCTVKGILAKLEASLS